MKYQIKKRITGEIMYEGEANSFKEFVEKNRSDLRGSDLRGSDLRGSDLRNSDLSGSNLSYSDLSDSDLRDSKIKNTQKEELLEALKIEIVE